MPKLIRYDTFDGIIGPIPGMNIGCRVQHGHHTVYKASDVDDRFDNEIRPLLNEVSGMLKVLDRTARYESVTDVLAKIQEVLQSNGK